jgi:hypothetical protein
MVRRSVTTPVRRVLLVLGACLSSAAGCEDATGPTGFAGTWAGANAQVHAVLYVDSTDLDTAYGRLSLTSLNLGISFLSPFQPGRVFADSLVFDVYLPGDVGFGTLHGRAIRTSGGLLLSYEAPGSARGSDILVTRQ